MTTDGARGPDPDEMSGPGPTERMLAAGRPILVPLAFVIGLVCGVLGTVVHRAVPPWGLVVALLAALSAAVLARALADGLGLLAYGGGLLLVTQLAGTLNPGGDVLIASDALGYAWSYASVLMCAIAAFLPSRLFAHTRTRARP